MRLPVVLNAVVLPSGETEPEQNRCLLVVSGSLTLICRVSQPCTFRTAWRFGEVHAISSASSTIHDLVGFLSYSIHSGCRTAELNERLDDASGSCLTIGAPSVRCGRGSAEPAERVITSD